MVVCTCACAYGRLNGRRKDRFKEVLIEIFIRSFSTWMVGGVGYIYTPTGRIIIYSCGLTREQFLVFTPGSFTLHVGKIVSLLCTVAAYLPGFRFSRSLLRDPFDRAAKHLPCPSPFPV